MANLIAQIIGGVLGGVTDAVGGIWGKVEGDQEHQYRADVMADRERLMEGRGGMSDWQKQQATAKLKNDLSAWQAEQLAKAQRGANTGAGESGLLAQQQGDVTKASAANLRGGLGDIRAQDLALADQQRQELIRRMEFAIAAENQRKTGTTLDTSSDLSSSGQQVGGAFRDYQGGNINNAANDIAGSSSSTGTAANSGGEAASSAAPAAASTASTGVGAVSAGKTAQPSGGSPLASASSPLGTGATPAGSRTNKSTTSPTQAPKASWQR